MPASGLHIKDVRYAQKYFAKAYSYNGSTIFQTDMPSLMRRVLRKKIGRENAGSENEVAQLVRHFTGVSAQSCVISVLC